MIETSVKIINKNLRSIGLELSIPKTKLMHFNKSGKSSENLSITVQDITVKASSTVRFLGITFDSKLSFVNHIGEIQNKCLRLMNILKYTRGIWWGAEPETLLILYKSMIRSVIEYGSFIYFPKRKDLWKKLETIQNTAIRLALGFRNSTPTNILLSESKLIRIKDRAYYLCQCYIAKILSNRSLLVHKMLVSIKKKVKTRHNKSKSLLINCIKNLGKEYDRIFSKEHYNQFTHDYRTIFVEANVNLDLGQTLKECKDPNVVFKDFIGKKKAIPIFTDGSKSSFSEPVGTACISTDIQEKITNSLPKETSIFTAETIALLNAVQMATKKPDSSYIILSDSLSALKLLNSNRQDVKANPYLYELKKQLKKFENKAVNRSSILFVWIPAHIGICGNETADLLAKEASLYTASQVYCVPFTDIKETSKKIALKNTVDLIKEQGLTKGADFFKYYHLDSRKPWFNKKSLPRSIVVMINRARSNHYSLNYSLTRIGILNDPSCSCGADVQDLDHVFWQCPLYNNQRLGFLK